MAGAPQGGAQTTTPNIMAQAGQGVQAAGQQFAGMLDYGPGTLAQTDISQYQNPFTQQVIDTSMQDLERQRQMQMNELGAQASSAGAYGGSRQGVAEALTNEAFARQGGQLASNLRMQGFNTAQQMAQQDIGNRMNVAQGLTGVAESGYGMGRQTTQDMMMQGAQQQALNQALIDAGRGRFDQYTGAPQQSLSYLASALGATPVPQTTTTGKDPGLFDYLTVAASAAPTLAKLSDEKLKTDIEEIKTLDNGVKVVRWKWNEIGKKIADPRNPTVGVIAQQVAKIIPDAVKKHASGYLMVDYSHPELRGI